MLAVLTGRNPKTLFFFAPPYISFIFFQVLSDLISTTRFLATAIGWRADWIANSTSALPSQTPDCLALAIIGQFFRMSSVYWSFFVWLNSILGFELFIAVFFPAACFTLVFLCLVLIIISFLNRYFRFC
jgi:hypothetical protein